MEPEPQLNTSSQNQPLDTEHMLTHTMKILLLVFGILEIPLPCIGLYLEFELLQLQMNLGTNYTGPVVGILFLLLIILVALAQIAAALFYNRFKFTNSRLKKLLIWGILLTVLGMPVVLFNTVNSVSSNIEAILPSSTPRPKEAPTISATSDKQSSQTYVIKELGIQFPINGSLEGLYYVIKPGIGTLSKYKYAYVSTKPLVNLGGVYCTAEDAPIGIITVLPLSTSDAPGREMEIGGSLVKQIGNNYIYYRNPQATCATGQNEKAATALQSKAIAELATQLKQAQLIQDQQ
jgi:hypothetical protein